MTLDHDTGTLEGVLTAGPEAGRVLDDFTLDQLIVLARGSMLRAGLFWKVIWIAGFPPGVSTRKASGQAGWRRGSPCGGERKNDGGGGLSDPWPAAGRGAR
jgi:hypothetical protein